MNGNHDGTAIRCDCCDRVKVGEIHPQSRLAIVDRSHGRKHVAVLTAREILERLSGTLNGSAVVDYVKTVFK